MRKIIQQWLPQQPRQKRWFWSIILLVVLLGWWFLHHQRMQQDNAPTMAPVDVAPVIKKHLTLTLHANGNVQANVTVSVKSQVDGVIEQVNFTEGQAVKAHDLLYTIDPRPFEVALQQAQANLAKDTANLHYAQNELGRNAPLVKSAFVSKDAYAQLQSQAEALAATVKADEAAIAAAQLQLDYCYIRSPINGITGVRQVDVGNLIKAANNQTLVTITQIQPISVVFSLPEQYLAEIRHELNQGGLPIIASLPQDPQSHTQGQVALIDNTVNNTTGTFLLKASFSNADHLLWPGQFINVTLPLSKLNDVLVVPAQAVQQSQRGQYVFVATADNKAEYREVKSGPTQNNETVILNGLTAGEKVVTTGQFALENNTPIKIITAPSTSLAPQP